jgi:phage-related minor tail protein
MATLHCFKRFLKMGASTADSIRQRADAAGNHRKSMMQAVEAVGYRW